MGLSSYRILTISDTVDLVHGGDVENVNHKLHREPDIPDGGVQ